MPRSNLKREKGRFLFRLVLSVVLAGLLPLGATPIRYKVGSSVDATPTCFGPAYDIGGGGGDVDPAIQWMIDQVRGATGMGGPKLDVVILRCSGSNGYNAPILAMYGVNSVESIVGTSVADFNDPAVAQAVANAEVIFFAGGNQANYIQFIKGTATDTAIRSVLARGGGLGGTSAGAAVQGAIIHDATTGSSTSAEALGDPYHSKIHFTYGWLGLQNLGDTLCEPHLQPGGNGYNRLGRLMAFVARQVKDGKASAMLGLGIDTETSLVVDKAGLATVMGSQSAYLVLLDRVPEVCVAGTPLTCSGFKIWKLSPGQTFNLASRPTCGYYLGRVTNGALGDGITAADYYTVGTVVGCNQPSITTLSPTSGPAGTVVTLTGTNLEGPSAVAFNGTAATFTALGGTQVKATVPRGATTGPVSLTAPGGLASGGTFTVTVPAKSLDLDASGTVDVLDMAQFAKAYLSVTGEAHYRAALDLNDDGVIDDLDLSIWLFGF
ncbi:MAG: Type 1 glutamine amidotransferase-like domain-containing protein [Holophagaceae bacterium]|uniref:Type 1 glutamine amidotransferase-like domain-containing protein n=1 Tax=Candidatus Geothrix skivensis TaxID=2954439 RepID=A0A9D7SHS6_9BACT|nr:Type 1 glutamine amidotransferase-like domain-containing protein [Candidatus Geothrix skivensis]